MDVKTTIISIIASLFALVICGLLYKRMIKREVPEPIGKLQAILPAILGGICVPISGGSGISLLYAFTEQFILPFSHDEVTQGKGSLIGKMPGDEWQQFANLRLLIGYMFGHPGKKLLFMGAEFGQKREWSHDMSLEWHVLCFWQHYS